MHVKQEALLVQTDRATRCQAEAYQLLQLPTTVGESSTTNLEQ